MRLSNGFGKPADLTANCWKLLVNDLCRQAVEKNILKLNSSGQQERNFLPISEILNVIDFLINNIQETSMTGRPCPINVGGRRSYSVYEMAKLIRKRCQLVIGADPDIRVPNSKLGDSNRRSLDYKSEKLLELGFRYSVSVEDEIDDLLWYCFKQFGKNSG